MVMRNEYRPYARVSSSLKRRVKSEARSEETTQSQILERIIREYFDRKDEQDD